MFVITVGLTLVDVFPVSVVSTIEVTVVSVGIPVPKTVRPVANVVNSLVLSPVTKLLRAVVVPSVVVAVGPVFVTWKT
jgi:hypothetical protein